MASSDDFPLIETPSHHSHSQSYIHAHTRHIPSSTSCSPSKVPDPSAESVDGVYYSQTFRNIDPTDPADPDKSRALTLIPNGKRPTGNPYYDINTKRVKPSCSGSGNGGGSGDPDSGTDTGYRGDYRKDREEWSDTAISCLLDAYTEKFNQLNRGNLRGRDWEEVADALSERCGGSVGSIVEGKHKAYKSVEQCKNKIDNLKKRYKVELQRMTNSGLTTSHWHWFQKMEVIIGNSMTVKGGSDEDKGGEANSSAIVKHSESSIYTPSNISMGNSIKPKPVTNLKWRRVVFKISGSALSGNNQSIDPKVALQVAREVSIACRLGVEVAIVVGGRNFFCGDAWVNATGLDRPMAYQIGMMATVMNSMLLQSALEKLGVQTRVQSAFAMSEVAEPYSRRKAIRHLEKGRVVIFGGVGAGTGNPLFTTDTAAALRASELHADVVLKGTNDNGVYDCQSSCDNLSVDHISFRDVLSRGITSMDMMALVYCEENGIPVVIFNLLESGSITRALCGDQVGTLIDQVGRIS